VNVKVNFDQVVASAVWEERIVSYLLKSVDSDTGEERGMTVADVEWAGLKRVAAQQGGDIPDNEPSGRGVVVEIPTPTATSMAFGLWRTLGAIDGGRRVGVERDQVENACRILQGDAVTIQRVPYWRGGDSGVDPQYKVTVEPIEGESDETGKGYPTLREAYDKYREGRERGGE
jgi:hypothetical protein